MRMTIKYAYYGKIPSITVRDKFAYEYFTYTNNTIINSNPYTAKNEIIHPFYQTNNQVLFSRPETSVENTFQKLAKIGPSSQAGYCDKNAKA